MAVKTITIDIEAYETLRRHKRPGESFSDVIKQHFRATTGAALRTALDAITLDTSALDATDAVIAARKRSRARVAKARVGPRQLRDFERAPELRVVSS